MKQLAVQKTRSHGQRRLGLGIQAQALTMQGTAPACSRGRISQERGAARDGQADTKPLRGTGVRLLTEIGSEGQHLL